MSDDGVWAQWRIGGPAVRILAHIGVAVEETHGRSARRRAGMLAYSLIVDSRFARSRRTCRHRNILDIAADVVDVTGWSLLTRDRPDHLRALAVATIASNLFDTGFRLGAGTTSVPVIEPARPWRPLRRPRDDGSDRTADRDGPRNVDSRGRSAIDLARALEILVDVAVEALPLGTAMWAARRRDGRRVGIEPILWTVLGACGGYGLARTRARAQASVIALWERRTGSLLEQSRVRSRVQAALIHNHARIDPKGMLAMLERAGSSSARHALDELSAAPRTKVRQATELGLLLGAAVDLREVVPPMYRTRWLPRDQVRTIRDEIARIDQMLRYVDDPPPDDLVDVLASDPGILTLEYRGYRIEAAQPRPDLAIRLEPTVWVVLASAALTLANTVTESDRSSGAALLLAFALQGAAAVRLATTEPIDRRGDRITAALLTASALVLDLSVAFGTRRGSDAVDDGSRETTATLRPIARPTGEAAIPSEACFGTAATQPVMLLLGTSWNDLRAEGPVLLGAALIGWALSLRPWAGRSWHSAIVEAAFMVMPFVAMLGAGSRTEHEAKLLDASLRVELSRTIEAQARIEAETEIARFVSQMNVVIDELPARHPGLTDDEVAVIIDAYRTERDRIADADPLELIGWS
ncbi:MAG: hypothetical protein JST73_12110 [Actinobacteria bacterium]|nr:hypothetical protein [Actinomycetota bacterium]